MEFFTKIKPSRVFAGEQADFLASLPGTRVE
jgi:hypothetical protein